MWKQSKFDDLTPDNTVGYDLHQYDDSSDSSNDHVWAAKPASNAEAWSFAFSGTDQYQIREDNNIYQINYGDDSVTQLTGKATKIASSFQNVVYIISITENTGADAGRGM